MLLFKILMKRRYIFTLEVTPLEVGVTYDELPSHLTLMSRFFSDFNSERLANLVRPLFSSTKPIRLQFGEIAVLGPKGLLVHTVHHSDDLAHLHQKLYGLLDSVGAEYEYPQFIGKNHKPHVTKREGVQFDAGSTKSVGAAYLIEIVNGQRLVRTKLLLAG